MTVHFFPLGAVTAFGLSTPISLCLSLSFSVAMKGDHLFSNLRNATFYQRVYLLGGEELLVLQSTVGHPALGDSFHQITDFNDLPTSLFACNVDQSVFEDQQGKVRSNHSLFIHGGESCSISPCYFHLGLVGSLVWLLV